MTTLRRLRALLAVLLATVLLAACGGGGGTDDSGDSPDGGETTSAETNAADGEWDGEEFTKEDFGTRMVEAQQEAGSYRMELTQEVAGQSSTTTGEGVIHDDGTDVHTKTEAGGETSETILVDGFFYLNVPSLGAEKPWLKIDPNAKTGMGALVGQLGGNSDPQKLSEAFSKAIALEATGDVEEIDGVDTREHQVSLPSSVLTTELGMPKELAAAMPETIEYSIWVDEQDLMRKMVMSMEVMAQQSETEILFTDYGADITIEAPPADQVTTKEPAMPGAPAPQG